jgi:nucleotide-binding universal stress UspA family protein
VRAAVSARPRPSGHASGSRAGIRAPVVVCGVDDTHAEYVVVLVAAELIKRLGGRLILLHLQPLPLIDLEPQIAYAAPQPKPAGDLLTTARELARLAAYAGVAASTEVRVGFGDAETRLLATASQEAAALIVVASRPGSKPGLKGSLPTRVIGRAACPVVAVPVVGATRRADSGVADWGRQRMASNRPDATLST